MTTEKCIGQESDTSCATMPSTSEELFVHSESSKACSSVEEEDGEAAKIEEEEKFCGPTFTPRLYKQRYSRAIQILESYGGKLKKVIDVGCAECKFLRRCIVALPRVRKLVGVDIDRVLLETAVEEERLYPDDHRIAYFSDRRESQLTTELYHGSAIEIDRRHLDVDAITAIEIVEHLDEDVLEGFPEAVFGVYKPRLVIITTPNQEFNVLFEIPKGKFRHWDHKFEWNREEFRSWCKEIVERYPEYSVEFDGVGFAEDEEMINVGPCSQIGIFKIRDEKLDSVKKEKLDRTESTFSETHQLMERVDFPWDPLARHALALRYNLSCVTFSLALNADQGRYEEEIREYKRGVLIPLDEIIREPRISKFTVDAAELSGFLFQEGYGFGSDDRVFIGIEDLPSTDDENDDSGDEGTERASEGKSETSKYNEESGEFVSRGGFDQYRQNLNESSRPNELPKPSNSVCQI